MMEDAVAPLVTETDKPRRKGVKRRAFLIGGAALVGGGIFALKYADSSARSGALAATKGEGEASFAAWLKIAPDDVVTLYTPHVDIGTGSSTALAQMVADELDLDWSKLKVEAAPAEAGFANNYLGRGFVGELASQGLAQAIPTSLMSFLARNLVNQITGGSSATRFTGQKGFRVLAAAVRQSLIEEGAERLGVPASELIAVNGTITHAKSGKALRYGELAQAASERSLSDEPKLKDASALRFIGKPVRRIDIPAKVDGSGKYGMDFMLPGMRIATVTAAPVRGGKLVSVDPAPAMAVKGVEKVVKLDDAVAVIAKGYWPAINGLRALDPQFSAGEHGEMSSASIFAAHDSLRKGGDPDGENSVGDPEKAFSDAKSINADYRVPFLHHAMMEPFALTAQYKDGKLDLWGGLQDPLGSKVAAVKASGLSADDVKFHPMLVGGGFGRKLPMYIEIIDQVVKLAMDAPYPVKLIWSREEEVRQGAYRPLASTAMKAVLGKDGKISAWQSDFAQPSASGDTPDTHFFYEIPNIGRNHYEYATNQTTGAWRSVNATQHGFFNESFMDELAHAAKADPYQFRRKHLPDGGRHQKVLDAAAKAAGWGSPVPAGRGRGIAITECFGTVCAHVIEASLKEDGTPKVHKVWAAVDCGPVINPLNAEAQVMGGIVMGLSSAIGEEITLEKGAVQQSSFPDYPVLKLADTPEIAIEFLKTDSAMGGLGEPGLPPAAPALANALFAVTGKRVRSLPIKDQAKA